MIHRAKIGLVLLVSMIPYGQAQLQAPVVVPADGTAPAAGSGLKTYTVPAGTRILLTLKNEVSTRGARPGDQVYFVSDFPVVQDGAVVLPAGMYVKGVIDSIQRPGKVKGRAQLQMHFTSIIFQNGVEVPLPGTLDKVPSSNGAKVKNSEGTIEQDSSKAQDTQRIATTTLEGTAVGSLVGYGTGHVGMGVGIGAAAGAAVGVLTTLLTRGHDAVIPQGSSVEMVVSRPIVLQQTQLAGMPASTGMIVPTAILVPAPAAPQPLPTAAPKPSN